VLAALELPRHEAVIPAHERIGGGNGGELFETLATERMSQGGQAAALGIGETDAAGNATASRASGPCWPRVWEKAWPMLLIRP
jgi:hypothetical protein